MEEERQRLRAGVPVAACDRERAEGGLSPNMDRITPADRAGWRGIVADEREVETLHEEQVRRFQRERRQAEGAVDDAEVAQHERRAEKAGYLADRLAERAESERES